MALLSSSQIPSWRFVLIIASVLRIGLLLYGEWQDRNMAVKFTDVDYRVFTDAAEHVLNGRSPYERATYRYTPLLAFLMTLNLTVCDCVGKVIFSLLDLAAGALIHSLVRCRGHGPQIAVLSSCCWLFNPLTMTISTRGNAESLLAVLVLLSIWLLYRRQTVAAGVALGFAVHCKFFPIIYTLPMFLFIDQRYGASVLVPAWCSHSGPLSFLSRLFRPRRLLFAVAAASSFLALSTWMYAWYGDAFVQETFLYHLTRRDNRHNFSVYFYPLYLTWRSRFSSLLSLVAFLPQVLLVALSAVLLHQDLAFCCFVQTFIFVTFNKVCTSQYFVWYLCLLPLLLPSLRLSLRKGLALCALWGASQGLWLWSAYLLEFAGLNTFLYIWLASLLFFGCNAIILAVLLSHHSSSPVFPLKRCP